MRNIWLLILFLLADIGGYSQEYQHRKLDIYDGLPSNHIYNSIVDKNGYIWFTSTKGVIKYNGYTFKIFNSLDGLPRDDVWYLFEDKKGRIWLSSITEELGYIYDDKYYSLTIKGSHNTFYPKGLTNYKNAIAFFTAYVNNSWAPNLYFVDNESIKEIKIPDSLYAHTFSEDLRYKFKDQYVGQRSWFAYSFIEKDSLFYSIICNHFCTISLSDLNKPRLINAVPVKSPNIKPMLDVSSMQIFDRYIYFVYPGKDHSFVYLDRRTGDTGEIELSKFNITEPAQYYHKVRGDSIQYVITKSGYSEFKITDSLEFIRTTSFKSLFNDTNIDGHNIVGIFDNKIWGNIFTTKNSGAFIVPTAENTLKKIQLPLKDFVCLGNPIGRKSYWWNSNSHSLACLMPDLSIKNNPFKLPGTVYDIIPYSGDTLIILGACNYFFTPSNGHIHPLNLYSELVALSSACMLSKNKIISVSNYGLNINNFHGERKTLSNNRFRGIVADVKNNEYWAYNTTEIVIYNNTTGKHSVIDAQQLRNAGIKKIESIAIDSAFGNVFIKDNSTVFFYNKHTNTVKTVSGLEYLNKADCRMILRNGQLMLAGKIGVVIIPVEGVNQTGHPIVAHNQNSYRYIYDVQANNSSVILSTDQGFYHINLAKKLIPLEYILANYQFVYKYNHEVYNYSGKDSLKIDAADPKIKIDIINPYGNGQVKYKVTLNKNSAEPTISNEIILPYLVPDSYYELTIEAYDDVWQSKAHTIVLYIQPKWYQTHFMRKIFWIALIAGLVLLMAVSAIITRRLVLNANKKRNARMELELKSIYAQINPHFIFNSLNSALLLVSKNKTEEAYTHISKFSRLLRSYIKSSRNKHVLLAEELKNLTNYIDLQQVRFKDRFEYNIHVASSIDTNTIYIPSLLLQPFVENAIEHGLLSKDGTGHMVISFSKDGENLICTIDDDGIGRKESKANKIPNPVKEESYGELLIKDLVSIFNKYEHMNIAIDYTDKTYPETGTTVTIKIKLNGTAQI